jgi:hypothetical protein
MAIKELWPEKNPVKTCSTECGGAGGSKIFSEMPSVPIDGKDLLAKEEPADILP